MVSFCVSFLCHILYTMDEVGVPLDPNGDTNPYYIGVESLMSFGGKSIGRFIGNKFETGESGVSNNKPVIWFDTELGTYTDTDDAAG